MGVLYPWFFSGVQLHPHFLQACFQVIEMKTHMINDTRRVVQIIRINNYKASDRHCTWLTISMDSPARIIELWFGASLAYLRPAQPPTG